MDPLRQAHSNKAMKDKIFEVHNSFPDKCVNTDVNQCVNTQLDNMDVSPNLKCSNSFKILADKVDAKQMLEGKQNLISFTQADLEPTQGKSLVKTTVNITDSQVSTNTVDKHNMNLSFKPKHRNDINLAVDNATLKTWDGQIATKYGFFPLGTFCVRIRGLGTPVQVICWKFITKVNLYVTLTLWMPKLFFPLS